MSSLYRTEIVKQHYMATCFYKAVTQYETIPACSIIEHYESESVLQNICPNVFRLEASSVKVIQSKVILIGSNLAWLEYKLNTEYHAVFNDARAFYSLVHLHKEQDNQESDPTELFSNNKVRYVGVKQETLRSQFKKLRGKTDLAEYFNYSLNTEDNL